MTNTDTDILLDLSRMYRGVVSDIAARQTGETPRGRCYVEPRRFNGTIKWLPMIDGAPAEGRDHEDACCDFPDQAIEIAARMSRMHGRAEA